MIADRLVDEAVAIDVEEDGVLAVVERESREVLVLAEADAGRHQVSVEPCVVRAEARACVEAEPQPDAAAVRVGTQRNVTGVRVDERCAQIRIALEPAGGKDGALGANRPHFARGEHDFGTSHLPVLDEQLLRVTVEHDLAAAALANYPLAGMQVVVDRRLMPGTEAEHLDRRQALDAE